MQRRLLDYVVITLKGIAMGAADVVPGVSGGTIAFISGIYEELITSINNINLSLLKTLKANGLAAAWKQLNGNFLLALVIGIAISLLSLAKGIEWLLHHQPVLLWSFFFGLVLASILFIGKQITKWSIGTIIGAIAAAFLAYYITTLPSMSSNDSSWFLFIAGALAICAMILPGISGAFILVLLGAYGPVLEAINNRDFKTVAIIGAGAIVGLLSFSKLLKWLFTHYRNFTLAILTGFIFGSLNKIWPWKKTIQVFDKSTNTEIPFSEISDLATLSVFQQQNNDFETLKMIQEVNISPIHYSELNQYLVSEHLNYAIILMVVGFLTIFILEKLGAQKND
jgi:putative membrane protein